MTFAFQAAASEAVTTSGTSLTPSLPSGASTPTTNDAMFLWAKAVSDSATVSYTPPAGWTALGSIVRGDTGAGLERYGSLHLWWKAAGASETAPTVTISNQGTSYTFRTAVYTYRSTPAVAPRIVTACQDGTGTGSTTYTPAALTSAAGVVIVMIAQVAVGGTLTIDAAASFTSQVISFSTNAHRWMDRTVSAGSVTLPTLSGALANPWMSKAFTLNRTASGQTSVGFLGA